MSFRHNGLSPLCGPLVLFSSAARDFYTAVIISLSVVMSMSVRPVLLVVQLSLGDLSSVLGSGFFALLYSY